MSDTQKARDNATQQQYRAEIQNFYETHTHQIDGEDAKDYLLTLFKENFPTLRAEAMNVATELAGQMAMEVVVEIAATDPTLLRNLRKPRIQAALLAAQQSFAETGDPDTGTGDITLGRVLAKLVGQLAREETRSFADIALRQAIEIAPLLTNRQMNALSVTSMLRGLTWRGDTPSEVAARLAGAFDTYFGEVPTSHLEYSYMSASGAGTYLYGTAPYETIREHNTFAMRKHFRLEDVPANLRDKLDHLAEQVPGTTGDLRLKEDAAEATLGSEFNAQIRHAAQKFVNSQLFSSDELRILIQNEQPALAEFLDLLDSTDAMYFACNAIGFMLAKEELAVRYPNSDLATSLAEQLQASFAGE